MFYSLLSIPRTFPDQTLGYTGAQLKDREGNCLLSHLSNQLSALGLHKCLSREVRNKTLPDMPGSWNMMTISSLDTWTSADDGYGRKGQTPML
jgi:hypothetical protein